MYIQKVNQLFLHLDCMITRNVDDIKLYSTSVSHLATVKLAKNHGHATLTYKHTQKIFPKE